MIEKIAFYQNRTDDTPNVELAEVLAKKRNEKGLQEIVNGLHDDNKDVVNDCIKVLYEVGYRNPDYIEPYVHEFLAGLKSRNNRLIWGSCIALSLIADKKSDELYKEIDLIKKIYESGTVITTDNCISIFSGIIKGNSKYEKSIFPILMKHIENCRPKEVAQHAERISICINGKNSKKFIEILSSRMETLSDAQAKRVKKVIDSIEK